MIRAGDRIGILVDRDSEKLEFYKNGNLVLASPNFSWKDKEEDKLYAYLAFFAVGKNSLSFYILIIHFQTNKQ